MELRPGYKKTDIGEIPETWGVKSVREFAHIKTGPFGTLLKASEYSGNVGVPLISVGEIGAGRLKVTGHTPLVPETVVRRLPQYVLRSGDIVFGRKGAVDRSALVTENEDGWFLGSDGISIRPQNDCHPAFVARQFQRHEVQHWLLNNATGTTMASLSQGILERVRIPFAPLPEQRAIAETLNDVDALLDGLDRLIAKKRDLKQAAMQQLLTGQTRLPGFHGEWEIVSASEVGRFRGGNGFPLAFQGEIDGDIPFFKVSDMNNEGNETYMTSSNHRISAKTRQKLGATLFPAGSIVFAKVGAAIFLERKKILGQPSCIDNNLSAFVLDLSRTDVRFIHYKLLSMKLGSLVSTTALPSLNGKQLGEITFRLPSLPEQVAISDSLTDFDESIAILEKQRAKTRAVKQGMMQELLTGRTRLI